MLHNSMKSITCEVLDIKFPFEITENSVEMNALAAVVDKDTGQPVDVAHDRAVDNTLFHGVYGGVRSHWVDQVVKKQVKLDDGTLLAPKTVQAFRTNKKTGAKVPYLKPDESDRTFLDRALALNAITTTDLYDWAVAYVKAKPFAAWLKERTPSLGSSKPSKTAIAKVEEWFTKIDPETGAPNPDKRMDNFQTVSGLSLDGIRTDREALARKVDEFQAARVAQAAEELRRQKAETAALV